jgi:hypothetical protein
MMPSPPIHQCSDARHSGWLSAGTAPAYCTSIIGPQSHRQPCRATPAALVHPRHPHPSCEAQRLGRAL